MTLSETDLDARRLETRANDLLRQIGLRDVVFAYYDQKEGKFLVEDEAMFVSWPVPFSHQMKQKDWDEIYCWIMSFSPFGCTVNHTHYSPY